MKHFEVRKKDSQTEARIATFKTAHGTFHTPNFMPVGTRASVKGIDVERLKEAGADIMLVNTYHLWIRPGMDQIASLGGIHSFAGWDGPILSDSGGFQVFSLKGIRKISEE
ncbi:MAG: tRNA-guanine transglycosylase, partial [SAR324 cluster bacterium]|nr:tRNA-guanine transglycosylase [SAR324 cluster bacterium]